MKWPSSGAAVPPADAAGKPDAAGVAKQVKRLILGKPQTALVRFARGMGDLCLIETEQLLRSSRVDGAEAPLCTLTGSCVEVTKASLRSLLSLTALSTTGREVLWVVGQGRAGSVGEIKDRLAAVAWPLLLPPGSQLALRVASTASHVFHEGKVEELVTKALKAQGLTVVAKADSTQLLDVKLQDDRLLLALSLAGRPLYQRRYKKILAGTAPLKEDLAAACVRAVLAFAREQQGFAFAPTSVVVPFAGSGTLGFEAAIAMAALPPWIFFGPLGAEALICTPQATIAHIHRASLTAAAGVGRDRLSVVMIDQEAEQVDVLRTNAAAFNAKLAAVGLQPVDFTAVHEDFFATTWPASTGPRLLLMNPPYGLRLDDRAKAQRLYARLAKMLRTLSGPMAGVVLAPSLALAHSITKVLPADSTKVRPFNHGGRTVYMVLFALQPVQARSG